MEFEIDDFFRLKQALLEMCRLFALEQVPKETVFSAKLVADELITNALKHGGGKAFLSVSRGEGEIYLNVKSLKSFSPPEKSVCPDVLSESGRGLFLVDSFCDKKETTPFGIKVTIKIK